MRKQPIPSSALVACRVPDPDAIAIINAGAARTLQVSEDAAAEAIRVMFTTTQSVAEPGGAVALAGLCSETALQAGRTVANVQSGGNIDSRVLAEVLGGSTPEL